MSKPILNKNVNEPRKHFVRPQRIVIGEVTLYKRKEMKPEEAWGIIIKTVDDKGYVDDKGTAVFIPKSELDDLWAGRYYTASAYVFEPTDQGKKEQ